MSRFLTAAILTLLLGTMIIAPYAGRHCTVEIMNIFNHLPIASCQNQSATHWDVVYTVFFGFAILTGVTLLALPLIIISLRILERVFNNQLRADVSAAIIFIKRRHNHFFDDFFNALRQGIVQPKIIS